MNVKVPAHKQPSYDEYNAVFQKECTQIYGSIIAFERALGYALDRKRLEHAARVLACPLKVNPPNWQHGRVIYSTVRNILARSQGEVLLLDIGTAKGFSAMCLLWALLDSRPNVTGRVVSLDVIDPLARVRRNTIAEVDGYKTLAEILKPWPESEQIEFIQSTGVHWLSENFDHITFAFIDGKHKYEQVRLEAQLISQRQLHEDYIMFDDVHIDGVYKAATELKGYEKATHIKLLPGREYYLCYKQQQRINVQ
jgi:predicted O-methyltransferase YrrM